VCDILRRPGEYQLPVWNPPQTSHVNFPCHLGYVCWHMSRLSLARMPQAKSKPSDIASEAKKTYTPYIQSQFPHWPPISVSYSDSSKLRSVSRAGSGRKLRVAVIDGDPVDVALDWHESNTKEHASMRSTPFTKQGGSIPVVSMANEKRAGGDWESGLIAPEECLCRRSNLAKVLITPSQSSAQVPHYPIRTTGGIYSPNVGELAT